MSRAKTALIVFPPFNTPTSPPLGAAMLKGFVERELPGWRVKVFDLNLNPHARYLANYRDHAVVIYDRRGDQLRPVARQFPQVSYAQAPATPWAEGIPEERSLKC